MRCSGDAAKAEESRREKQEEGGSSTARKMKKRGRVKLGGKGFHANPKKGGK